MKKGNITLLILAFLYITGCSKKQTANPGTGDKPGAGTGGSTNNCNAKIADVENLSIFPADNSWNQDVSTAAIDPYSSQIIAAISASHLKADFGSGLYDGTSIGIPFDVVCSSQPKVKVTFRAN